MRCCILLSASASSLSASIVFACTLTQHVTAAPVAYRAGLQRPIKFATVVTDLTTCHNTWFHKDVDRCFVATEEAKQRALTMGVSLSKVTVHGLPIRPSFSQKLPSKRQLRQQLGMDLHKPAVLLVGMPVWPYLLSSHQASRSAGVMKRAKPL